ncbi:exodeoxyribonuclease VII large subunit [Desulfatitalea tepidiphila]|uniref:exodeoxyribonuclease VII large subunit n=1 Tax=Desulfatitalea tepidiphila TaxID=1185843 RepID=UPI0009788798|nr:exodeoxyribonuclease VII large subunit [Desulfatitalea tepidiphila]
MNEATQQATRQIFTVSQLTKNIKSLLEQKFSMIWISGEISNLRIPNSGHAYFSLKDDKAQIIAVMFRGQMRQLRFDLDDGLAIVGLGRVSVYEPRGNYQIILEYVEPMGAGALQLAFEQTKQRLTEEGLFSPEHKIPLPFLPRTICVITSPTGAAIQDIINITFRRFPTLQLKILPVRVQGHGASEEIVNALRLADQIVRPDVIILARGGGSMEDLAAFNAESVARAIYACETPVVSAVGHEIDFTIADFVADVRAPTPSAAAEIVVPVKIELLSRCSELRHRCLRSMSRMVLVSREHIHRLGRAVVHPLKKLQAYQQRVDDLQGRLFRAGLELVRHRQVHLMKVHFRLTNQSPVIRERHVRPVIEMLYFRLLKSNEKLIAKYRDRVHGANVKLEALSPKAVLQRGYSITRTLPDLKVVMDAVEVHKGQRLEILLARGKIQSTVDG